MAGILYVPRLLPLSLSSDLRTDTNRRSDEETRHIFLLLPRSPLVGPGRVVSATRRGDVTDEAKLRTVWSNLNTCQLAFRATHVHNEHDIRL